MSKLLLYLIFFVFSLLITPNVYAAENSYITIVNPVRISSYIQQPEKSLAAEYAVIKKRNLPATWLLTYDAIQNEDVMKVVASFDEKQELGIFLEVTNTFASDAKVLYKASDSWHRAKSLFLTGYIQEDRIKLIDEVFNKFKDKIGYYPTSVGSWWTDAYSLAYLSRKYKVNANLSISDQLALDEYTVWGTYYSTPYYPSKIHAAIPAKNLQDKTDVVMLRWAPRDPLNGYESPSQQKSAMYSAQDYGSIGLPDNYFEKISAFYTLKAPYNKFAHFTVGLESDFSPEAFSGFYSKRLDKTMQLDTQFTTMRSFAAWYKNEFKEVSPSQMLISDDFLGGAKKVFWYQNPNYRAGLIFDQDKNRLTINDLRSFYSNLEEPFYKSPNGQNGLYIHLPHIVDSIIEPSSIKEYNCGDYIEAQENYLKFAECEVIFRDNSIELKGQGVNFVMENSLVQGPEGMKLETIGLKIPYGFVRRIPPILIGLAPLVLFLFLTSTMYWVFITSDRKNIKILAVLLIFGFVIFLGSYKKVFISQSELQALEFLSRQQAAKIVVFDKDCLNCTWVTKLEPAGMAGYKDYVSNLSGHTVVKSVMLPLAKSPGDIKKELHKNGADYIYLVKYEAYIEELPYSPEASGLVKIFENANAQILKVVK